MTRPGATGQNQFVRAQRAVEEVGVLTADNPRQQRVINEITEWLKASTFEPQTSTFVPEKQESVTATANLISARSAALSNIRDLVSQMVQEENRLLRQRSEAASATYGRMKTIIIAGNALALLFLLAVGVIILQQIRKRSRTSERVTAKQ